MGQNSSKSPTQTVITPEILQQSQKALFESDPQLLTLSTAVPHIQNIISQLNRDRSFEKIQGGFHVNPLLLSVTHQINLTRCLKRLLSILVEELKGIISAKVLALVPRDKFNRCLALANFIIYLSDQNMLQNINLLNIRTDLDEVTREAVNKQVKESAEVQQLVFQDVTSEELQEWGKILRLGVNLMIDLHLKLITRSDFTLTIVDRLSASCFVLYCKFFFGNRHDFTKRERTENAKVLIRMGAYFIGLGVERKVASLYELGVLLVQSVAGESKQSVLQTKALPSHLFKSIPIVNNNEMSNWLAVALLFQLKYVKNDKKLYNRLNVNRIPSLRLLEKLFKSIKAPTQQLTFMLQQLCLQTKPSQIQRVYVCSLATIYSAFEGIDSEIIKRFNEGKELTYNVKIMNKQKRVKPQDVLTELETGEQEVQKQFLGLSSKYITHVIFHKNDVLYEYSDKALWNLILYNLEHENEEVGELREPDEE